MKLIRLLFLISFIFYFIGQLLWTIVIIIDKPVFEEWLINIPFGLFSIIALIASVKLYQHK
ncbi:MAG: hypothetical protein P8L83_06025 [Flavobacteriaceae bacterium]|nr:hypothetical protein [Flavobacteriaceae bacterium]